MKLTSNWRSVILKGSMSFWGNIALAVASAIAGSFAYDGTFCWSMFVASLAVAALRLVAQKGISDADD